MTGSIHADVSAYVRWGFVPALLIIGSSIGAAKADEELAVARQNMIRVIELHARIDADIVDRVAIGGAVLDAMAKVPRHEFVAEDLQSAAYEDRPLPIGHGQTISQPFIVALMTEMLELEPMTLSWRLVRGPAIRQRCSPNWCAKCTPSKSFPHWLRLRRPTLEKSAYENVWTYFGDGYFGVPEAAPFDGIMVTAAANHVPPPLIKQLKPGARMIIPVGSSFAFQYLMMVEKDADGRVTTRQTLPVSFVPLTRGE